MSYNIAFNIDFILRMETRQLQDGLTVYIM